MEYLIIQHQQVQLKYIRKIKSSYEFEKEQGLSHQELLLLFLSLQKEVQDENEQDIYHMMALTSAMIEYEEHIEHLDTLISSFQTFHKDDDELKIDTKMED